MSLIFQSELSGALYQTVSAYHRPIIHMDHYCSKV